MAEQYRFDFEPDPVTDDAADDGPEAAPTLMADAMEVPDTALAPASTVGLPASGATLADQVALLRVWPGPSPNRRRKLVSAVLSTARMLHLRPPLIPLDVPELRRRLEEVDAAAFGIAAKTLANVKANFVFGLKLTGCAVTGAQERGPLSAAWLALLGHCPTPYRRLRLVRFARWCSARGIAPDQVDDATLDAFLDHLERTALKLKRAALRRQVAKSWNAGVGQVPGWPGRRLEERPARESWTLPWEAFPPELRRDVDACLDRLASTDPLDKDGPVKALRPATLKWRRFQLRAAASSLVHAGVPGEEIRGLDDLLRPDRFKLLINNLLQRYGRRRTGFIYGLATAMKSIARHHCKFGYEDLDRLRDTCRRVMVKQRGMTAKNRDRLRALMHPDARDRLLLLPQRLMKEACRGKPDKRSARTAQTAVLLEIVLMAPLRAANLASLQLGRSLVFLGEGRRQEAVVTLPEAEVKNEIALDYPLPAESTRLVRLYVDRFLPLLAPPGGGAHLFPGLSGGAMHPASVGNRVAAVIRKEVGCRVHLHLLRHFAAAVYLQAHPGAYESVTRILGHATASAALNAYVGLETGAAARHFDELVLRLRRQAEGNAPRALRKPQRRGGRR